MGIVFVHLNTKTMAGKKKTELINPKREPLTPEKLRSYLGLICQMKKPKKPFSL